MTIDEVKKIAGLARLELTNEELERYAGQLTMILEYVAKLNEVDTGDVPITSQVTGLSNVFREDAVQIYAVRDQLLAQAPEMEDGGVKVKSVFGITL